MRAIAIIPARGGSKRLPRKNLRPLSGVPLVAWSIRAAREAVSISEVYVSTDDLEIATVAKQFGAEVVMRPADISGPEDKIETALIHAMSLLDLGPEDIVVTLQPTSPIRRAGLIDRCVSRLHTYPHLRSVLTVRPAGVTWWKHSDRGRSEQWVHQFGGCDIPQSQFWSGDMERWSEDGSVFATQANALKARLDRRCRPVDLIPNEWTPDIDDEADFRLAEMMVRALEEVPA